MTSGAHKNAMNGRRHPVGRASLVVVLCAGALARCHAAETAPSRLPSVTTTTAPSTVPAASTPVVSGKAPPVGHPFAFAGSSILAAAWVRGGGGVMLTPAELWSFRPEEPERAHATPFAHPLPVGLGIALSASEDSDVVAVGLYDGSVDVFRGADRVRTLPPVARDFIVGELSLSPDERTLTVTGSASGAPATVTPYDLASGSPGPAHARKGCRSDHECPSTEVCSFTIGGKVCMKMAEPGRPRPRPRRDGAYAMTVDEGLRVVEASSGRGVIEWGDQKFPGMNTLVWRANAIEVGAGSSLEAFRPFYRFGGTAAVAGGGTPVPIPPDKACGSDAELYDKTDLTAVYTTQAGGIQRVCHCTSAGCTRTWLNEPRHGPASEPVLSEYLRAASEDGALLTMTTADDSRKNVLLLRRHGAASIRAKVPADCGIIAAAFVGARPFLLCLTKEQRFVVELSPRNLSVVARRLAPPTGCMNGALQRLGDELFVGCDGAVDGALVSPDWVSQETTPIRATVHVRRDFGVLITPDGKVEIAGDQGAAEASLRCYDGARLLPFAACRGAALASP